MELPKRPANFGAITTPANLELMSGVFDTLALLAIDLCLEGELLTMLWTFSIRLSEMKLTIAI